MKTKKQVIISVGIILFLVLSSVITFNIKAGPAEEPLCEDCYRYLPISGYIQTYGSLYCWCGDEFEGYSQNCISVQGYPSCGTFLYCSAPCHEDNP